MTEYSNDFTVDEILTVLMAREVRNDDVMIVGVATPMVWAAFTLAKMKYSPIFFNVYLSRTRLNFISTERTSSAFYHVSITSTVDRRVFLPLAEFHSTLRYHQVGLVPLHSS